MTPTDHHSIGKKDIIDSLQLINHKYFHIDDLSAYADKLLTLGCSVAERDEMGQLVSYILYYNNGPTAFISMVWTSPDCQGKGLATRLIKKLIQEVRKDIILEVHEDNPALSLYEKIGFIQENKTERTLVYRYPNRLSIMQPYVFPYIGYFHLIDASHTSVFYDDVNYIKRGWINRNRILLNKSDFLFTVPLENASQNKLINEVKPIISSKFKEKFFAQIKDGYKRAPNYSSVVEVLKDVFSYEYNSASDLSIASIKAVHAILGKELNWVKSSIVSPDSKGKDKADRLIHITKTMGFANYVNASNGRELYSKDYFLRSGVNLQFVESSIFEYKQFENEFIPWLSIIDVLMFNDRESILEQIKKYRVVD